MITSPDWEDPTAFFGGGLFDLVPQPDGLLARAQALLDPENLPQCEAAPQLDACNQSTVRQQGGNVVACPLERARFKADNFSYQTLLVGEALVVELYTFQPGAQLPFHRHVETEHVWTIIAGDGEVQIGSW